MARIDEDKFTGSPYLLTRGLELNLQLHLEAYGVWRSTGVIPTQFRFRTIKKPGIKQRSGETVLQYSNRILKDYRERPEFYLEEHSLQWTKEEALYNLEQTEMELWVWANKIKETYEEKFHTRNRDSCFKYGQCKFYNQCLGKGKDA